MLALIAGELGAEGLGPEAVVAAADAAEAVLAESGIEDVPAPERLLVLAATGPSAVTAREGALKLREAARLAAEGYDAEYLLHGSAVPLDERDALVLVGRDEDGLLHELANAAEAEGIAVGRLGEEAAAAVDRRPARQATSSWPRSRSPFACNCWRCAAPSRAATIPTS